MAVYEPSILLVFSGKRKSGKDFVCSQLKERFGSDTCVILTLSAPLKKEYARVHGLDYEQLLTPSPYKERYRKDMVIWGEAKRREDPAIFCSLATKDAPQQCKVWLISDARRKSDIKYFKETYSSRAQLVRVQAAESVRASRGYIFKEGIDDSETECGLDEVVTWDYVICNDGNADDLDLQLTRLVNEINDRLSKAELPS